MIKILIFTLLIFLSGCTTFQTSPSSTAHVMSWKARTAELNRIQSWTAKGSVSIQKADKADIASLQWQQQMARYHLALFGPLGFGRVEIAGEPGVITLTQSDKAPVSAATPELLMQNQLGWYMPLSNLYSWMRGLPAPGIPAQKTFDADNRLAKLEQQGWTIEYLEYMSVDSVDLPRKVQLTTGDLKIKLVLRQWAIQDKQITR